MTQKTQYQIQLDSGKIGYTAHLVKPLVNEQYFIIPKEEALKKLSGWRDITQTTSERKYPYYQKINKAIYAQVYGGYGEDTGGVLPGTKEYYETEFPGGANLARGGIAMSPKEAREEMLLKTKVVSNNEEIEEHNKEVAKNKLEVPLSGEGILSGASALATNTDDTPAIVEAVTDGGPVTADKPPEGTKVPPIIIQHSECGHLTFGDEKDGKSQRPRDVGLYGGDSQKLRLFRDGGFELCSSESQGANKQKGSLINQVCNNGFLTINSEGDITIRAKNKLILKADQIEIEADNASEDGVTIMAEHDIKLRANNNTIITSDNITIDAKERIVSHSEGWQILIGQCIRLHEPQTKMCPAFMREYIEGQIKTLKN